MIAEYDDMVGAYVTALEQSGLQDNTVLVLTSDHGDMQVSCQLSLPLLAVLPPLLAVFPLLLTVFPLLLAVLPPLLAVLPPILPFNAFAWCRTADAAPAVLQDGGLRGLVPRPLCHCRPWGFAHRERHHARLAGRQCVNFHCLLCSMVTMCVLAAQQYHRHDLTTNTQLVPHEGRSSVNPNRMPTAFCLCFSCRSLPSVAVHRAVMPTIMELGGVPLLLDLDGTSLVPLLQVGPQPRSRPLVSSHRCRSVSLLPPPPLTVPSRDAARRRGRLLPPGPYHLSVPRRKPRNVLVRVLDSGRRARPR